MGGGDAATLQLFHARLAFFRGHAELGHENVCSWARGCQATTRYVQRNQRQLDVYCCHGHIV